MTCVHCGKEYILGLWNTCLGCKYERAIEKLLADVQGLSWGLDPVQQAESILKNKEGK